MGVRDENGSSVSAGRDVQEAKRHRLAFQVARRLGVSDAWVHKVGTTGEPQALDAIHSMLNAVIQVDCPKTKGVSQQCWNKVMVDLLFKNKGSTFEVSYRVLGITKVLNRTPITCTIFEKKYMTKPSLIL